MYLSLFNAVTDALALLPGSILPQSFFAAPSAAVKRNSCFLMTIHL